VGSVAGDKDSASFQCGGGDDEVRITTRQSSTTGDCPKIYSTIEYAVGDW